VNSLSRAARRLLSEVWASAALDVEPTPDPEPAPAPSPEPVPEPVPEPEPARVLVPYWLESAYTTAFEPVFRRQAADEALVLERLAVETARIGSPWEAARRLFAPDAPCTSLRATQASEQGHLRVFYPTSHHEGSQAKSAPHNTQPEGD